MAVSLGLEQLLVLVAMSQYLQPTIGIWVWSNANSIVRPENDNNKCSENLKKGCIVHCQPGGRWDYSEATLLPRCTAHAHTLQLSTAATAAGICCLHTLMHFNGENNPPNCLFPWGDLGPHLTWFPVPTRVQHPNSISIGSAVFCTAHGCVQQTHRSRKICSNRLHFCILCMQHSLITPATCTREINE